MIYTRTAYCALFIMVTCHAHAQLSVSYQPYEATEIVFKHGIYKITGKNVSKCGLEAIKVTLRNEGAEDAVFKLDHTNMTLDAVYTQLSSSLKKVFCYDITACVVFSFLIAMKDIWFIDPWFTKIRKAFHECALEMSSKDIDFDAELSELSKNIFTIGKGAKAKFHQKLDPMFKEQWDWITFKVLAVIYPIIVSCDVLYTYRFNHVLHTFLKHQLASDELVIAPGSTVEKILFIERKAMPIASENEIIRE